MPNQNKQVEEIIQHVQHLLPVLFKLTSKGEDILRNKITSLLRQEREKAVSNRNEEIKQMIEENSIFITHHAFAGIGLTPVVEARKIINLLHPTNKTKE